MALLMNGMVREALRIDLDDEDSAPPHRELDVHQAYDAELERQRAGRRTKRGQHIGWKRVRWERHRRIARVNPGLLDVLQQAADDDILAIRNAVDVDLDGVLQELVDENRLCLGIGYRFEGNGHVARELLLGVHDFHGTAAEYVARAHDDREADLLCHGKRVLAALGDAAIRAFEVELGEQLVEALAVFGAVDGVSARPENRHAGTGKRNGELQRRLPAELHDESVGLFDLDDVHDVLERQRLEVELIRGVVVGGDRFGIAVDHDGLEADLLERERSMNAAVVELDPLPDPVRTASEDHDLLLVALRAGFTLEAPRRVHVGRQCGELRGASVDTAVDRPHPEGTSLLANLVRGLAAKRANLPIAEAERFGLPKQRLVERLPCGGPERPFELDDLAQLLEEPDVDGRGLMKLVDGEPNSKAVADVPEPLGERSTGRDPKSPRANPRHSGRASLRAWASPC